MQEIMYEPSAIQRLEELLAILYEKEYVGFRDTAVDYVHDIFAFITRLPYHKRRRTKNPKYGTFFCSYKRNSHTTWFICFDVSIDDTTYLVRSIVNNHTVEYPKYITGSR